MLRAGESCWQVASPHFPACACGESGGPGSPTTCEAQTKRQALASRAFDFHVAVGCRGGGGGRRGGKEHLDEASRTSRHFTLATACPSAFAAGARPCGGTISGMSSRSPNVPCSRRASQRETLARRPRAPSQDGRQAGPHTGSWKLYGPAPCSA